MARFAGSGLKMFLETDTGDEAERLGLTHVGNGRYADSSGVVTYRSQDNKLVRVFNEPQSAPAAPAIARRRRPSRSKFRDMGATPKVKIPVEQSPTKPNPSFEELKATAKQHRNVILSKKPIGDLTYNVDTIPQESGWKPKGFWYGIGDSWVDFLESYMPDWKGDYLYEIDIDYSRVLVLKTDDDLRKFESTYGVKKYPYGNVIDWGRVAQDYSGIEIPEYHQNMRMRDWYYPWDVASACIWDPKTVKSMRQIPVGMTNEMFEAKYAGNIGMMELIKFMDAASPEEKKQFQELTQAGENDRAMQLVQQVTGTSLEPNVPTKKAKTLMAFDFDNTLVVSDSKVIVNHADGSTTELSSHEYPKYRQQPGDELDFSEFETVKNPQRIEKYIRLLQAAIRSPNIDVVITTARGNPRPIAEYLRTLGIETGVRIKALGSGKPSAKLLYLKNKIQKGGYGDLAFFDDSEDNVRVVGALRQQFPELNVNVHSHLVPPEEYQTKAGVDTTNTGAMTGALNQMIRNPETNNQILVKTALSYDKSHPAYKVARSYLSRVGRS